MKLSAQFHSKDSIKINTRLEDNTPLGNKYNFDAPLLLMASGLAITSFDHRMDNIRDLNYPNFHQGYDDYTQYLPAALMFSLKAAGVKSKSSWKDMLISDALSVAIVAASVNSIKYSVKRLRPDGSAYNSFPSGHTATAFMTATMLHKEYGHRNPWYSIGAYLCAGATGFTRHLNNRHWLGDIFMGAGIGSMSVELAYLLNDVIFKTPHSTTFFIPQNTRDLKPSFISYNLGIRNHLTADKDEFKMTGGSMIAIEGAYYPFKKIGFGGMIGMTSYQCKKENVGTVFLYGNYSANLGIYHSEPISKCFRIENKALIGGIFNSKTSIINGNLPKNAKLNYTIGTSFAYWTNENLQFKLFCDYILTPNFIESTSLQELSIGLSTKLMLD